MYRLIGLGALGAFGLVGCKDRCNAEVSLGEDAGHSAMLVWDGGGDSATVAYSTDGDPGDREGVVTSSGEGHTATLWGLPPLSEVRYSFTSDGESCEDTFTASGLPSGLPTFATSSHDEDAAGSWRYIAGVAMGEVGSLFIIDREGRWRWHQVHDNEVNVSAVLLGVDGETMLYNSFDQDRTNDIGQVHTRSLLGDEVTDTRTEGAHHTFTQLPDGTIAFPSVDVRSWLDPDLDEEVDVVGDRILEIAPDGTVTEIWSIWDHEEPFKHDTWDSSFYGDLGQDWTHGNALNYSPERGTYLFSLGHLDTIYEIDRTGEVLLRLTPDDIVSGTAYNFQHDPSWTDDGTLTLLSYPDDSPARAIEYAVSAEGTMEELWSYERDRSGTTLLGQVRRLPNGNTFISFGGMGEMREVTPEGEVVWQLNASLGSWFGNAVLLDTLPSLP
ncbi:MAG: hypothetical protein ACI8S6_001269 [Myxococcota bacterium]